MNIILFSDQELGLPLDCKDTRYQHIVRILHKKQNDEFEAGVINGKAGKAVITSLTKDELFFDFIPQQEKNPLFPVILIVGFPRPIQLKRLLRDVSSLGVQQIHLTGTELGEKSYLRSTLVERGAAEQGLLDGSVQAKSTFIPELFMHEGLKSCIQSVESVISSKSQNAVEKILLDNVKPENRLSDLAIEKKFENRLVVLAVGSERGWTDKERQMFRDYGFSVCGLGERVLRTETAVVTGVSLVLAGMNKI